VGDPACWMANVCPVCGRFLEEPFADRGCAHCGAPAPAPEPVPDGAERPEAEG